MGPAPSARRKPAPLAGERARFSRPQARCASTCHARGAAGPASCARFARPATGKGAGRGRGPMRGAFRGGERGGGGGGGRGKGRRGGGGGRGGGFGLSRGGEGGGGFVSG